MKTKKFFIGLFAALLPLLPACSSDTPEMPEENGNEVVNEAPKCDGTVSVRLLVGQSRAASAIDPSIDRLTATRCDVEDGTYTLVSYHGRNKERIGMVQVINRNTGAVVSELFFDDARVNYCAFYNKRGKQVAYVGVDKDNKKSNICGIVAVPMKNGKFDLGEGVTAAQLTPYLVKGVSVNCIKFIEQASGSYLNSGMIVASGGNNELSDNAREAGFTKFKINLVDPTILEETGNNMISENFRGYWISHNIESDGGVKLPVAYTYRTVEGTDLVYKMAVVMDSKVTDFFNPEMPFGEPDAEVEVMRRKGTDINAEDFGRYSVSMFLLKQGRFLIVSTGSKVLDEAVGEGGGTRVYRFDHNNGNPSLTLVDVWNKACHNTSNKNTVLSEPYIYASCSGSGIFKCKLDYYEVTNPSSKTPMRFAQLVPVAKRVTTVMTESGTPASTNYVQCNLNMDKVHIAGGYEGYYTLDLESSDFVPADPRRDLVKH